jgi:hypothetical protein
LSIAPEPTTVLPFSAPSADGAAVDFGPVLHRRPGRLPSPRARRGPALALHAQVVDHAIDVGVFDFGGVAHDFRLATSMSPKSGTTSKVAT